MLEPSDRPGPVIASVASVAQADDTPAGGAGKQNPPRLSWQAPADFVRGFRSLADVGSERVVARFDPSERLMELAEPLSRSLPPGSAFELLSPDEAPVLAARLVIGAAAGSALPPVAKRLGTTRGTNALLERQGARVALFTTRGFGDALVIGTQQRIRPRSGSTGA